MSILAVGTVAFDSIETPYGSAAHILGGSAVYITLAARFFSEDVRLVAVVGADFPAQHVDRLRKAGIDLAGLDIDREGMTFAWEGRYHRNMNDRDTLATHLNVLATFTPRLPETYHDSRILCLGNLDPEIQARVLDQVTSPEMVICDTMNFWIEHTPDALRDILHRVDCLIINDAEARELSGELNLIRAARAVQRMGPRVLVVKKGEHGALLFAGETVFSVPAFPMESILDPTGAGDSFAGGFAGYLAHAGRYDLMHLKRAVICGSALASFSVEQFGPERLFTLTKAEIDTRIDAFRDLAAMPEFERMSLPRSA